MRPAALALLPFALLGCYDDDCDDCDGDEVVAFLELEPNDLPPQANHFGLLYPGERFYIDGSVRDDAGDPFDGFAFTASEPIHVDFQLFHGDPGSDLDVCLYDPLLDQTLACWATADRPERGGVDVFEGGLDFHLVVESFAGDAPYSLEIVVFRLASQPLGAAGGSGLAGTGAAGERAPDAPRDYRQPPPEPVLVLEHTLEFFPETGLWLERLRRLPAAQAE